MEHRTFTERLHIMNYWELRKLISRIVPRMTQLNFLSHKTGAVKEKGRKSGYHQYNLQKKEWIKQERLLNTEAVNSFVEVSLRAAACPMPLNIDTWDGLLCPYNCIYCFANAFRASLYTAFFDNSKTMGLRHCNPDFYKKELDKLMVLRGKNPEELPTSNPVAKAIGLEIPMRFGIRFEDFLRNESRFGVSLELLKYLRDIEYPIMINTKSDLVGRKEYVEAMSTNKAGAAVHITMISSDENLLSKIEPGAPSFQRRLEAGRVLSEAGVRVVARIEPYLIFVNDSPDKVQEYMEQIWAAGIRNITFDTYSYTALNPGIRQNFINKGFDFERMYLLGCDSQSLGSLLLGKFMDLFRENGFSCSSFDMGNVPSNQQMICCEVGDSFSNFGFNYGSTVAAAWFIKKQRGNPTSWKNYEEWVNKKGGFLSDSLKMEVKHLWNIEGNLAYSPSWASGMESCGLDEDGIVWKWNSRKDHRYDLLTSLL